MDQAATLRLQTAKKNTIAGKGKKNDREKKGEGKSNKNRKTPRVIAVTSGKGGTGKTNVVANLAYALSLAGEKVMILDADLGLGNMDILLGITSKYTIQDILKGRRNLSEVIIEGPEGIKILPAGSGIQELSHLSEGEKLNLMAEFDLFEDEIDTFLIDTGAGISSNVMYFNVMAQEIIVVLSPEPTSITDAYAIMKVLSTKYSETHFKLLVNEVKNERSALVVYNNICNVADKFLNISIDFLGYITHDENVPKAVMQQTMVLQQYPDSPASKCFTSLAEKLKKNPPAKEPKGSIQLFWHRLLDGMGA